MIRLTVAADAGCTTMMAMLQVTTLPEPAKSGDLAKLLHDLAAEVDEWLRSAIRKRSLPENLSEAVLYAALGPGKRSRPILAMLSCEAVGGRRRDAAAAACALELIHAFSLVHDDLPAMDDDDIRRGRPTLHVHAGEAMAVLAGDVMLSLAVEVLANAEMDAQRRATLIGELTQGTTAMIAGQVLDTLGEFPPGLSDRQRLDLIHRNKTGALIRAACRMGGICGCATAAQLEKLSTYGEAIGLMFQIVDDLLDVTQSSEHLGKAAGKDASAGKLTFPRLLGIEASQDEVRNLKLKALSAIESLGGAAQPLRDLCEWMATRTK